MKESQQSCVTKNATTEWQSSAEIVKRITDKRTVEEKNAGRKQDLNDAANSMRDEFDNIPKSKYIAKEQEQLINEAIR